MRAPVSKRIISAGLQFLLDGAAVQLAFLLACLLRFRSDGFDARLWWYLPVILSASVVTPCVFYIGGLYSEHPAKWGNWKPVRWLLFGMAACLVVVFSFGALDARLRVGRGVLLMAVPLATAMVMFRHVVRLGRAKFNSEKALCLVSGPEDEVAADILAKHSKRTRIWGIICLGGYEAKGTLPVLGSLETVDRLGFERNAVILVRDGHLAFPQVAPFLRRWRYEGVDVLSLTELCEEVFHAVPLQMVTENWLFWASAQSNLLYVKRLKRLFDVVASLAFMMILSPALLVGVCLVKRYSSGPVFFRQERLGRLGRPFEVVKLRTMRVDAEKDGPKWASTNDARVFPAGKWLRKFRVDEIPQLWNVLKGDMSFVGPRPERRVFVNELAEKIPHYRERLFIQPGLTGWAQVQYPYGASVDDAWRKLEYDLYYMKHMSLLLDFFVLLETVRTVVMGGVWEFGARSLEMRHAWCKLSPGFPVEEGLDGSAVAMGKAVPLKV